MPSISLPDENTGHGHQATPGHMALSTAEQNPDASESAVTPAKPIRIRVRSTTHIFGCDDV